jgi:hypothetical protein
MPDKDSERLVPDTEAKAEPTLLKLATSVLVPILIISFVVGAAWEWFGQASWTAEVIIALACAGLALAAIGLRGTQLRVERTTGAHAEKTAEPDRKSELS